jgi:hypothetical protein
MSGIEFFFRVVTALNRMGVDYCVVGSFAANLYMEPRSTKDADVVLELDRLDVDRLLRELGGDFELDSQMSFESITLSRRTVIRHRFASFEIELFSITDSSYDQQRFSRRVQIQIAPDLSVFTLTPEDVVVTKLLWANRANRPKDKQDALNVTAANLSVLDQAYIRTVLVDLGIGSAFDELLRQISVDDKAT